MICTSAAHGQSIGYCEEELKGHMQILFVNAGDPEQFRQYHLLSQESFHEILAMISI